MNLSRLMEWDARLSERARLAGHRGGLRSLAALLAHTGDSWFWLLGLAGMIALADGYWRQRALALAGGVLVTAVLVLALKFTFRRRRPAGEWGSIYRKSDPHSFPSGHAARGSMLAAVALGLGPLWLGLVLLIWAPLMSLARVAMGVHYLSDVLAGLAIGAGMGLVILQVVQL